MVEAFAWGLLAAASLLVGAVLASVFRIPTRLLGLIMAFGVGVLISAVSFELIDEAFRATNQGWAIAGGLVGGALTFFVGDTLIEQMGGRGRRKGEKAQQGSGLGITLGAVLDSVPESVVIGLSLVKGGVVSVAMVVAVFLSNLPEAIGATSYLKKANWKTWWLIGMWLVVVALSAFAALAGYTLFDTVSPGTLAFTLAFAGGGLLTMVADSMMPEAYRDSGKLAGLVTTLGFGVSYLMTIIS